MKKLVARTLAVLSAAVMSMTSAAMYASAYNASTVINPSYNNETPASGSIKAAVVGSYRTDIQAALDRINQIRLEACEQGVPDPRNPNRKLTKSDYVPIKWSAGLESVARVRAAEASIRIAHTRPSDKDCFSISSDDVFNCGEVLAWNNSSTMVSGIDQFYREKSDWVNQNSAAVTGHYTQMIDPGNTYVGLGCFTSSNTPYGNTVAGRFGYEYSNKTPSQTKGTAVNDCMATVIVNKNYLSAPILKLVGGKSAMEVGNASRYELRVTSNIDNAKSTLVLYDGIKWTSSDSKVATVDKYGRVVAKSVGKTVITGTCNGYTAAKIVNVTDNNVSNAKISISGKTYTYTGKALKPSAKVTLGGKTLKKGTDYTISYSSNKNTGRARVRIVGKGKYKGSKVCYFYIKPARQKITAVSKPASKKLRISWKKAGSQATGYQIFYSRTKSFAGKKMVTVKGGSKSVKTISGLSKNRTYYIKVRAYKQVGSTKLYGVCSPVKAVKTK